MDPKLLKLVNARMPKFNEQITSGFHQRDFDNVEQTYERGLQTVFKEIEERGVWFFGLKSVKPTEMFEHISSKTQNKAFETNKESLYPVGLQIGFGPTKETAMMFPTTYVFLPYADEYGDVWIRGTQYSLLMVLADRGFSVTKDDQIFVRVPGYKFKVGTEVFEYVQVHHETANLFESKIPINLSANRFYKCSEARKPNPNKTPLPLLAWYLFAENGVAETFKRFAECEYAIGDRDAIVQAYPASKGWSVFTTQGRQLVKCVGRYDDCGYAIAVRPIDSKRKGVISTAAHQYVASLLFMFDCFSSYVDLDRLDDRVFWQTIIGYSSVKPTESEEHLIKQMDDHFDSMSKSLDQSSIQKFAEQRIVVKDMFELFDYIIVNRTEIVKTTDKGNMLHKEVCSSEFTIDKLITAAHRFKHEIKNTSSLDYNKVKRFVSTYFRIRDIESAAWTSNMEQEETPTDNPFADYGLGVLSQAKVFEMQESSRSSDFNPNDPTNEIHPSLIFTMSWQRITKRNPDGRGFLLPCVHLVNGKYLGLRSEHREKYDAILNRLTRREPIK